MSKRSEYYEKLKDPRWQKKRLEVFQRDKFTCQKCFDDENNLTLNIHHLHYEKGKDPWDYPLESLVTLCEECHAEEFEGKYQAEAYLIKTLRKAGFFNADIESLATVFFDEPTQTKTPFCHTSEFVLAMIEWILSHEEIQREMLERYQTFCCEVADRFLKQTKKDKCPDQE